MQKRKGLKLAFKLSLTVAIPILLITVAGVWLGVSKQRELSEALVEREVGGVAKSLCEAYREMGDKGKFSMDGTTLMKGTETLSGNYELMDLIKKDHDVELSLFYGDTRILTTLTNDNGSREINTKMSAEVYEKIKNGENYYARKLNYLENPIPVIMFRYASRIPARSSAVYSVDGVWLRSMREYRIQPYPWPSLCVSYLSLPSPSYSLW